jgi:hypothetical protein
MRYVNQGYFIFASIVTSLCLLSMLKVGDRWAVLYLAADAKAIARSQTTAQQNYGRVRHGYNRYAYEGVARHAQIQTLVGKLLREYKQQSRQRRRHRN